MCVLINVNKVVIVFHSSESLLFHSKYKLTLPFSIILILLWESISIGAIFTGINNSSKAQQSSIQFIKGWFHFVLCPKNKSFNLNQS